MTPFTKTVTIQSDSEINIIYSLKKLSVRDAELLLEEILLGLRDLAIVKSEPDAQKSYYRFLCHLKELVHGELKPPFVQDFAKLDSSLANDTIGGMNSVNKSVKGRDPSHGLKHYTSHISRHLADNLNDEDRTILMRNDIYILRLDFSHAPSCHPFCRLEINLLPDHSLGDKLDIHAIYPEGLDERMNNFALGISSSLSFGDFEACKISGINYYHLYKLIYPKIVGMLDPIYWQFSGECMENIMNVSMHVLMEVPKGTKSLLADLILRQGPREGNYPISKNFGLVNILRTST
jgi:hypothetical protein